MALQQSTIVNELGRGSLFQQERSLAGSLSVQTRHTDSFLVTVDIFLSLQILYKRVDIPLELPQDQLLEKQ